MKKLFEILKLLIKCNFKSSIEKKDIIIYDCVNSFELSKVLTNKKYFILSSRKERIIELFFNKKIILFILINFFSRSVKLNYMIGLIKEINPKIVITNIDNSPEFSLLARYFSGKINFIAIQNANRIDVFENRNNYNKVFFFPILLCLSEFDIGLFKNKDINVKKFLVGGSLRNSYFQNFLFNDEKKKTPSYDICFVCKKGMIFHDDGVTENHMIIILNYLAQFLRKTNRSVVLQAKSEKNDTEEAIYKKIFSGCNYKISWKENFRYESYKNISTSKIVIGLPSTLLREAYFYKTKVLCCEKIQYRKDSHPFGGLNYLCNFSYKGFEERLNHLFDINYEQYLDQLEKPRSFYMSNTDTIKFIKNLVNKELEDKNKYVQ